MMVDKIKVQIHSNYSLDGFVAQRIHFSYETRTNGGNKKIDVLEEDGDISQYFEFRAVNGDDKIGGIYLIKVQFQMIVGNDIEEDCSCVLMEVW